MQENQGPGEEMVHRRLLHWLALGVLATSHFNVQTQDSRYVEVLEKAQRMFGSGICDKHLGAAGFFFSVSASACARLSLETRVSSNADTYLIYIM